MLILEISYLHALCYNIYVIFIVIIRPLGPWFIISHRASGFAGTALFLRHTAKLPFAEYKPKNTQQTLGSRQRRYLLCATSKNTRQTPAHGKSSMFTVCLTLRTWQTSQPVTSSLGRQRLPCASEGTWQIKLFAMCLLFVVCLVLGLNLPF